MFNSALGAIAFTTFDQSLNIMLKVKSRLPNHKRGMSQSSTKRSLNNQYSLPRRMLRFLTSRRRIEMRNGPILQKHLEDRSTMFKLAGRKSGPSRIRQSQKRQRKSRTGSRKGKKTLRLRR